MSYPGLRLVEPNAPPGRAGAVIYETIFAVRAATTAADVLGTAVAAICATTGWPVGHFCTAESAPSIGLSGWHSAEPAMLDRYRVASGRPSTLRGSGLPEYVFRTGNLAVTLRGKGRRSRHAQRYLRAVGAEAVCAFPVRVGDDVVAVLEFFAGTQDLAGMLGPVTCAAEHVGLMLDRVRLESELASARGACVQGEADARELLDAVSDGVLVFREEDGVVLHANAMLCELFGASRDGLVGTGVDRVAGGWLYECYRNAALGGLPARFEMAHRRDGGSSAFLDVQVVRSRSNGHPSLVAVVRDVTDVRRASNALRESEERYVLAASGTNDGLWDWDIATNQVFFSPRWKSMLGYSAEEVGDSPNEWFIRVHPDDILALHESINRHLGGESPHFEAEHRILHKDGTYRWIFTRGLACRDADGAAYRMAGSLTEVTERRNAQEELVKRAYFDALTDLPNRALFIERLWRAVESAKRRTSYMFAVLFVDLDRFKVVNDTLGHLAGDSLLISIARRLEKHLRPVDTFARIGGDEFAILLEYVADVSDVRRVAERIHRELETPFSVKGQSVFTSASIGIALSTTGYARPEDLLREADLAMYRAKAAGRARYVIYDATLHEQAVRLMRLENDLRVAFERGALRVEYQPIIRLETGELAGFEALVRWHHDQFGEISPSEFVPLAEEIGLIHESDVWVLRTACRQVRSWHVSQGVPVSVNVNLSGRELSHPDFVERIDGALLESGLDPTLLKLEVTETVLMENTEVALKVLGALKERGIRLLIDDFGTGYSSLSYLHRFPFDTLKIDQSFVSRIGDEEGRNHEVVRAIIHLAHALGLEVVAEGNEALEVAARLQSLGCEYGQGYALSRPLDDVAATEFSAQAAAKQGGGGQAVEP
jgi:diguanylate cyclase (GGDEF)-like protein/PAS domain S-box-containing protein